VRSGKFKSPYGIERLQSATNLLFIERSLVDNLVPNRDLGVQLYGDFQQGAFGYQLAVLNGVPDGGSTDLDVNDGVDVAARLFSKPFVNTTLVPLRGLGVGVAGTWGEEQGTASSPQLPQFRTSSRNVYFKYVTDNPATAAGTAVANRQHWRVSPQGYYYYGPFGSMFEYGISDQEILKGATTGTIENTAWQLRASYLLTGEDSSYTKIVPKNNFGFGTGGWGAWELAIRYANLNVDGEAFAKGFADSTKSVSNIDSLTTALNWYLNPNILWALNYEHSWFKDGVKTGNRDPENVFLTRVQFLF
jgi:phosphate-selective porin OprO/OprP